MTIDTYLGYVVLSGLLGFAVISKVPSRLHTPLMSGTNFIHGIVLAGALLVVHDAGGAFQQALAFAAVACATGNVVGAWAVTDRMLDTFRSPSKRTDAAGIGHHVRRLSPRTVVLAMVLAPVMVVAVAVALEVAIGSPQLARSVFARLQDSTLIDGTYIVASAVFVLGLMGLRRPQTAVRGNRIMAAAMVFALLATLLTQHALDGVGTIPVIALAVALGTAVSVPVARMVKMTAMPQLVAVFNGLGGGAVALIASIEFLNAFGGGFPLIAEIPGLVAAVVGATSFSGSAVAFAKLQEILTRSPIRLARHTFLSASILAVVAASSVAVAAGIHSSWLFAIGVLAAAAILGIAFVLPIGGGDMPVVISLLNAFTGVSVVLGGIALGNTAMMVLGALVAVSGALLTGLMATAMGRPLLSIMFGGFGGVTTAVDGSGDRTMRPRTEEDAAADLKYAERVIIVPGYGLAVAQAQRELAELASMLGGSGVDVRYAIHGVAGRMPGHMSLLLAEVDVAYEQLIDDLDFANEQFTGSVALVVGANDIVNPNAGMPFLAAGKAKTVLVIKRGSGRGFSNIDNPLLYSDNTSVLFGDAKDVLRKLTAAVKEA
jgi:NAD(P) transhydrogenase subunit beta